MTSLRATFRFGISSFARQYRCAAEPWNGAVGEVQETRRMGEIDDGHRLLPNARGRGRTMAAGPTT